uniref:Lipoprotein n=1 Tax=Geobacter sp. (strain M21) TaxID=443144 RepID=C6E842_GEOSM
MERHHQIRFLRQALFLPVLLLAVMTCSATAGVNLSVNIGPPIVVAEPPAIAVIPGSGVYFVPRFDIDLFFYSGYWWSPRGDRWYRSREYNGPWRVVSRSAVPRPVYRVPSDYRSVYVKERRIPYGQWKKQRSEYRGDKGGRGEYRGHGERKGEGRRDGHGRGGHD